jgi:FkbM family methyltransferase
MPFFQTVKQIYRYISESPSNKGQKAYRVLLAIVWQFYKRVIGLPIISRLDNGASFILLPNSTNSTGNIYVKTYEAEYIYFLRKEVLEGGIFLDIGAHMGLYTLLLKDKFSGGFCFEPSGDNLQALRNNLAINNLQTKFRTIEKAVSDREGFAFLQIKGAYSGVNALEKEAENFKGQMVNTTSIDAFLYEQQIKDPIRLIKIDTEGHEMKVLEGARETLKANRECIVVFENSLDDTAISFFSNLSYKLFSIDKNGTLNDRPADFWKAYNLIAIGPGHPLTRSVL